MDGTKRTVLTDTSNKPTGRDANFLQVKRTVLLPAPKYRLALFTLREERETPSVEVHARRKYCSSCDDDPASKQRLCLFSACRKVEPVFLWRYVILRLLLGLGSTCSWF